MKPLQAFIQTRLASWGIPTGVALVGCLAFLWAPNSFNWMQLVIRQKRDESTHIKNRYQEQTAITRGIEPIALGDRVELPRAEGWVNSGNTTPNLDGKWTVLDTWALW